MFPLNRNKQSIGKKNRMKTTEQKTIELFSHAVLDRPKVVSTESGFLMVLTVFALMASFASWLGLK